jgi:hypothetical protein
MNHDQLFSEWQGRMSEISDDIAELVIAQYAFMDYSKKSGYGSVYNVLAGLYVDAMVIRVRRQFSRSGFTFDQLLEEIITFHQIMW